MDSQEYFDKHVASKAYVVLGPTGTNGANQFAKFAADAMQNGTYAPLDPLLHVLSGGARSLLSTDNDSENGYAQESAFMRSLLVLSHLLMLPSLYVLWPARSSRPIVVLAIIWSFIFSSQYHLCYSFDKCIFSVKDNNRLYDYVFSPMILGVMFTTFAFPAIPRQQARPSASAPYESTIDARTTRAFVGNIVGLNVFCIVLYVIHVYVYVYYGATPTTSIVVPIAALLPIGFVFLYNYGQIGIVMRIPVFVSALFFEALAYSGYWLGDSLGSFSHTLWHALSFIAMYVFFRLGPILVPYNRNYVAMEAGVINGVSPDPCCGARYDDDDVKAPYDAVDRARTHARGRRQKMVSGSAHTIGYRLDNESQHESSGSDSLEKYDDDEFVDPRYDGTFDNRPLHDHEYEYAQDQPTEFNYEQAYARAYAYAQAQAQAQAQTYSPPPSRVVPGAKDNPPAYSLGKKEWDHSTESSDGATESHQTRLLRYMQKSAISDRKADQAQHTETPDM